MEGSLIVAALVSLAGVNGRADLGEPRTVDVVRSYGYEAEEYSVTTEDGYVLALTHIKSKNPTKLPVFFMHGVIAASDQWILRGPGEDLAFILVDDGHDVWLGDQRGNYYSHKHMRLNSSEPEFWDFSFHESGKYDLPAFFDEVLRRSRSHQLHYIGHSMGTTVFFVMASIRPDYNHVVNTAIQLSPVAYPVKKYPTPVVSLALRSAKSLTRTFREQDIVQLLPRSKQLVNLVDIFCSDLNKNLCINTVSQFYGIETAQTNTTKLRTYLKRLISGTSVKTVVHLSQIFNSNDFAQFDYGKERNFEVYGSKTPPSYPVEKVTAAEALYYSDRDPFLDNYSIDRLERQLPNIVTSVSIPNYNHIDLVFADNAADKFYKSIVKLLSGS